MRLPLCVAGPLWFLLALLGLVGFSVPLGPFTLILLHPCPCALMSTPTDQWYSWTDGTDGKGTLRFVGTTILPALREQGFEVCSQRALRSTLEAGLEPIPEATTRGHQNATSCSFEYFLNLLWQPILKHIESLSKDPETEWTESLGKNQAAILSEMSGVVLGADETLDMDQWVEFIQETFFRMIKVKVPGPLILKVVSQVAPLSLDLTRANAMHLLRSSLCSKLIGHSLAAQVNRLVLAEIAQVLVELLAEQDLNLGVRRDLVASLQDPGFPGVT